MLRYDLECNVLIRIEAWGRIVLLSGARQTSRSLQSQHSATLYSRAIYSGAGLAPH